MSLHSLYRRLFSESTRAAIRGLGRRIMPGAFESMRRGVIGDAIDSVPPASAAMTPPPSRYDELYFARRNTLIQSLVERAGNCEPLDAILAGFDARVYDERLLFLVACAHWLRYLPAGVELLDVSGTISSKMLNQAFAGRCARVCFTNLADSSSTVMRTWSGARWSDGYQRFPEAYRFGGAIALWCRPRKNFNLVMSGFTIPGKNSLFLARPLAEVCTKMSASLMSGGRLFVGVADEQADPAAVESALAALADCGVIAKAEWYAAGENGWAVTPEPRASERGDHECSVAAIIRGVKE